MTSHDSARSDTTHAHLYLLTTMVLFGSAFTSSKALVAAVPHEVAAALRFGGGALVLLVLLLVSRRRRSSPFTWVQVVRAAGVGLIGVFAYNLLFFWGLSLAPSIDGGIIVPVLSPVLTTVLLLVSGRERASGQRLLGLGIGLAGAVVFFLGTSRVDTGAGGARLLGDLVFLLGALAWSIYSIASKRVLVGLDPLRATTIGTVVGALALLVPAAPVAAGVDWAAVPASAWANVVYLAVGPTALAYLFYFRGLRVVSPSTATVMMFSVPVFGAAGGVVLLGESIGPVQLSGAAVMLGGALLAVLARPARSAAATAATDPSAPGQVVDPGRTART